MQQTQQTNRQEQPASADQAPDQDKRSPVETVRSGAIGASIWQETSQGGKEYYSISLSRSFKPSDSDDFRYSTKYFSRNRDDLHKAIDQAAIELKGWQKGTSSHRSSSSTSPR